MPAGQPSLYDPDYHPKYVIEKMRNEGYIVEEFCSDWDIGISTFYDWRAAHPEFSEAYTRGQQYRKARNKRILDHGLYAESFNERAYAMLLRYSGETIDERIVALPELAPCKTFSEQGAVILGALACGKITLKEANGYVDIVGKLAKIDEVTELRRMLEEIETAKKQGR